MSNLTMTIWERLAVPFPETEVKHRPGAAKWDHKPSCEGARCRSTRDPEAHVQFSYVDARAVAQRLDDVLTPSGWGFTCNVIPGSDIVHGHLSIAGATREDHGYPNSERDEEPIKAATSDALKRCAVLFGVGRHLYEDNRPHKAPRPPQTAQVPRSAPERTPAPLRPVVVADDDDWGTVTVTDWDAIANVEHDVPAEGSCPVHHVPWVVKPAGVSKNGTPYDAFWSCGVAGPPWCKAKPTKAWNVSHPA